MKPILPLLPFVFLLSCNNTSAPTHTTSPTDSPRTTKPSLPPAAAAVNQLGPYTVKSDSVIVPPFQIEILLSPKAKERLAGDKETIIVDVFLQGEPKESYKADVAEDGTFYVGEGKQEIQPGQTARFDRLKFSKKRYNQLADTDAELSVNVYTGRRSSPNNLIECEFLSKKVSEVANQKFSLKAKLIGE